MQFNKWSIKDEGRKIVFNHFVLGGYKEIKITSKILEKNMLDKIRRYNFYKSNLGKLIVGKVIEFL
jgi:hypothetical protein